MNEESMTRISYQLPILNDIVTASNSTTLTSYAGNERVCEVMLVSGVMQNEKKEED